MKFFFKQPFIDVLNCLERLIDPRRRRQPPTVLLVVLGSLVVTWFVYVPIHELLHVGGCVWTGGEVSRLDLSPRYGAALLKNIFPFISSGSDYAGQLKGFDTHGSDLCYMATVFGPFALTVLIGVPLIKIVGRRRHPLLLGVAIVVGLAPFYNVPGDYFEMGSILTTRALTAAIGEEPALPPDPDENPPREPSGALDTPPSTNSTTAITAKENPSPEPGVSDTQPAYAGIRSDDIYRLVGTIIDAPATLGLTSPSRIVIGCLLVLVSLVVDVGLAFGTYWLGHLFARLVIPGTHGRTKIGQGPDGDAHRGDSQ